MMQGYLVLFTLVFVATTSFVSPFESDIFVAANDGYLHTMRFWENSSGYSLTNEGGSRDCATNPTWLILEPESSRLWCIDEGLQDGHGSINAFSVSGNGVLAHYHRQNVSVGPLHGLVLNRGRALAICRYGSQPSIEGGITTFSITSNGTTACEQTINFETSDPASPKVLQKVGRAHGGVLDQTGNFLVVLDLGADLVKVFSVDKETNNLGFLRHYRMPPGSGPRHAVFWSPTVTANRTDPIYLYVVSEFTSDVTIFLATYASDTLFLSDTGRSVSTLGENSTRTAQERARAAEIAVTPDNRFLVVSNRNDSTFVSPPSDSLATFKMSADDGALTMWQLAPAGGRFPRHFALSSCGHRVLISLQLDSSVAILDRDVESGMIGGIVARLDVNTTMLDGTTAGINAAIWSNEQISERNQTMAWKRNRSI